MEEIFDNLQANLGKMSMLGVRVVESGQYDYRVDLVKMTQVSHTTRQHGTRFTVPITHGTQYACTQKLWYQPHHSATAPPHRHPQLTNKPA